MGFTFIDLFSGIGGFRLPFEEIGGRCVFSSEKDRFARETYRANFDCSHQFAGDIAEVEAAEIPQHDVLLAGFPCQPFSIAGVSKKNALGRAHGFLDVTQGTLFFDIARVLEEHRPAVFLLENVKHLQGHDGGRTFAVMRHVLEDRLRYRLHHRVIDACYWVPQHRQRLFLVGFREECGFSFDDVVVPADQPVLGEILDPVVDDRFTLSDRLWTYLQAYREKHRAAGNGFGCSVVGPADVTRTLSARYHKDGSEILVEQPGRNPRRLTPRECCRLMGFPADFRIPVSNTQAFKQFGNAVVPPVVEAIVEAISRFYKIFT